MTEEEEFLMLGDDSPNQQSNDGCAILFLIAVIIYLADKC